MKKKASIAKNYMYNLIYQILVSIVPLITTPYLSRVLGAEKIGIYSYTISIVTYFILAGSLGTSTYGQREIAFVRDDANLRTKTFFEILIMKFCTLFLSMLIFYFSFAISGEYRIYYRILLFEIIGNMLDISWFFQGQEEFKKTVTRNMIVKVISVICIFLFIKSKEDLGKYLLIYVLSTVLGNLTLWFYLPKYLKKINLKGLNVWKHLKPTIALFIPQVAIKVYTVLDKTMIGTIVSDKSEVGFYEQSQKLISMLITVATGLGGVMAPRMANTFATGNKEKLKEYMINSFHFTLLISFPIMFGIISISSHFVPVFFGQGYDKVIVLMNIISPIILLVGLSNVTGTQYMVPTKRQTQYTISVVSGAIINFILNLILIRIGTSVGASIATVMAEMTVAGIQLYFLRKEFSMKLILKIAKNYGIASLIMFLVSYSGGMLINKDITAVIAQIIIGIITYFICLIILKDEFIKKGIDILKNKYIVYTNKKIEKNK